MYKSLYYSLFFLPLFFFSCGSNSNSDDASNNNDSIVTPPPVIEYGFTLDSFQVIRDTIQPNWTMSHMFAPYRVSQWNINQAADFAADSTV